MKKFINKIIIFFLFASIVCSAIPVFFWKTSLYEKFVAGKSSYQSIRESKKQKRQKKLIIGDSVANQLFPNTQTDSTLVSLACTQAIEICGHYLLLNNYMKAGNRVDTVFLIYTPGNFRWNLNQPYTFHYFVKPFYTEEYKPYFTKTVYEQIDKIPNYRMANILHIRTSNWTPNFVSKDSLINFISPISLEYLVRMKALAKQYRFQLILLAAPLSHSEKDFIDHTISPSEFAEYDLDKEFEYYINNVIYIDDSVLIDGLHFKKEYIKQYTDMYREKLGI
jgi:hypothetical protein